MEAMASCGFRKTASPASLKMENILMRTSSMSRMFSVNCDRMGMTGP